MTKEPASREEIAVLARTAGLDLPAEYLDELVDVYLGVTVPVLRRLRRNRARSDEPAHTYDPRKFMPHDR